MRLAILSDIHDHVEHLGRALEHIRGCDALLCCGDLCSPFVAAILADGFAGDIHLDFGNNDGDTFRIGANAARAGARFAIHAEFADIPAERYGVRIAMNHYPSLAQALARTGDYGLVCYGHNHLLSIERLPNGTHLVNPGPLMGWEPARRSVVPATFLVFDTDADRIETHVVS